MFGNKREKIYEFIGRLKEYKALSLKCLVMLKNKSGTCDGIITLVGENFIEVSNQDTQFISIPLANIDGVIALAKDEWRRSPPMESKKAEPIREEMERPRQSKYMSLGEVDY